MSETEVWRPIPGFTGYSISNLGRVRSYRSRWGLLGDPRILRNQRKITGYWAVNLRCDDGRLRVVKIHALLLLAFVGPRPFPRACARHLNDNRDDNRLENLAWGSAADNGNDAVVNGRRRTALTRQQALRVLDLLAAKHSVVEISRLFGVSLEVVWQIKAGITWKHLPRPPGIPKVRKQMTAEKARAIRAASGTLAEIAALYGVSVATVEDIWNGRTHRSA